MNDTEQFHRAGYLGDGVYAHIDAANRIVLTTGHHDPAQADNRIVLEPEVMVSFLRWHNPPKPLPELADFSSNAMRDAVQTEILAFQENAVYQNWMLRNLHAVETSPSVVYSLSCGIPHFHVTNREDLAALMRLAPKWQKSKIGTKIGYSATVDGRDVTIYAGDSALPGTCRMVKKTREIPAQEARTEEYEELVCELPGQTETPIPTH